MTQEQARENLLKLHDCTESFTLEFSGKKNRRINGTYFPAAMKIVINNRNFEEGEAGDSQLFYTAMHELAHHIQFTEHGQAGSRAHTDLFYSILDDLTEKAEGMGLYRYDADPQVKALIEAAQAMSAQIAALQRELGKTLNRLHGACLRRGVRYEDVLKRKVRLSARTGKKLGRIAALNLPEGTGFEMQEVLAGAKSEERRDAMLRAAEEGKSVAQVKRAGAAPKAEPDELETLAREKERIESAIDVLKRRLKGVVQRIQKLEGG